GSERERIEQDSRGESDADRAVGASGRGRSTQQHTSHVQHSQRDAGEPFDKHAGHSVAMFRDRFYVSLVLTIPVVLYSGILRTLFGIEPPAFPGSDFVPLVISTFVFFYGGLVFLRGAASELTARLPGMMTLISLAITFAFVSSIV